MAKKSDYDIIDVDHWEVPENPIEIIAMPNIPLPLHNCNPRNLLGSRTWNLMRKTCYRKAHDTCEICGHKPEDLRARHSHEVYDIDYKNHTATFKRCVCVCKRCVDEDTEVLTEEGWKKIPTVTTSDKVACFDKNDESISFENPIATIKSHHDKAIKISGNGEDLFFSDKHRLPLRVKSSRSPYNNQIVDVLAGDYKGSHYYNWVLSGDNNKKERLTDEERVYIAIEADGHLSYDKENTGRGERTRAYSSRYDSQDYRYTYFITLSKTRKIERFKELLESSGMKYKISKETSSNYCDFVVWSNKELKHFGNCFSINMGKEKALEFIEELVFWDGTYSGKTTSWFTNKPEEIAFVQAVAAQCSIRTRVNTVNRIGNLRKGKWKTPYERLTYCVCFESVNNEFTGRTMVSEEVEWGKDMYCLTVPTSYFVAKRGNLVFVTGNCHLLCIHTGRALTLFKHNNAVFTADKLIEGAEHAFTIISSFNGGRQGEPPLRAFSTWLEYLKEPELKPRMEELIKKYDIKFYDIPSKSFNKANWSKWKLIIGNQEYPTPFKNQADWEEKMAENNKKGDREAVDNFKGGIFDEINEILKNNID